MASGWHGGVPGSASSQYVNNSTLLDAISRAIGYWFQNDFTVPGCIDSGGTTACPCGTPGLWNTNWYSNIILIPRLVGEVCLLMNTTLTPTLLDGCNTILSRTYSQFYRPFNQVSWRTGANVLDTASISIDLGLLTNNLTIIQAGYGFVHNEVVIQNAISADGIRPDGSFGQHGGVLYNGNYGKDYSNDVLALEIDAGGTRFSAANNSREAFATLIDGDQWMIYQNTLTGVLHWDFSALGRFISFPVTDHQATGSINLNVSDVQVLGQLWQSGTLLNVSDSLNTNTSSANVGDLRGNRMFFNNDYMVNRGPGYLTTVKMFSTRTKNGECLNSQNPLGFHLSDGTVYTYLTGNEYEDIAAAWDWNLIPGITTDYGATPLTCNSGVMGVEAFVGGVSDSQVGVAVMRYTNPTTHNITWQKAWFFLEDDVQVVVLSNLSSVSPNVLSVLDQKRRDGPYYVNNLGVVEQTRREFPQTRRTRHHRLAVGIHDDNNITRYTHPSSLWHSGVGYTFDMWSPLALSIQTGEKTGNWSALGISTKPPTTVDFFTAWIDQPKSNTFAYSVFPGTTLDEFGRKASFSAVTHSVIQNDEHVSAILDSDKNTVFAVFWDSAGGSVLIPPYFEYPAITLSADANSAIIYRIDNGMVTVSDPSQNKTSVTVQLEVQEGFGLQPAGFGQNGTRSLIIQLPAGGLAGSSVTTSL